MFAQSLVTDHRVISLWTYNLRENAIPVRSRGRIHHLATSDCVALLWARVSEALLDSHTFGFRVSLSPKTGVAFYRTERSSVSAIQSANTFSFAKRHRHEMREFSDLVSDRPIKYVHEWMASNVSPNAHIREGMSGCDVWCIKILCSSVHTVG